VSSLQVEPRRVRVSELSRAKRCGPSSTGGFRPGTGVVQRSTMVGRRALPWLEPLAWFWTTGGGRRCRGCGWSKHAGLAAAACFSWGEGVSRLTGGAFRGTSVVGGSGRAGPGFASRVFLTGVCLRHTAPFVATLRSPCRQPCGSPRSLERILKG
jgi:hypothetical protein